MPKRIIVIGVIVLAVVVLIFVKIGGGNSDKQQEEALQGTTIDVNDPAYAGKNIYVEDGDIIIEEENGTKTIETTKTENKTDLVAATAETKEKYEITDVKVAKSGAQTKITGKVKSNNSAKKDITVQAKFYSDQNKVKGNASVRINGMTSGETRDFEITIVGDLTSYDCKVNVEFTN